MNLMGVEIPVAVAVEDLEGIRLPRSERIGEHAQLAERVIAIPHGVRDAKVHRAGGEPPRRVKAVRLNIAESGELLQLPDLVRRSGRAPGPRAGTLRLDALCGSPQGVVAQLLCPVGCRRLCIAQIDELTQG